MACWEWSHAPEAYENGRRNLAKKPRSTLLTILAEWRATEWNDPETMEGPQLDEDKYEDERDKAHADDVALRTAGVDLHSRKALLAASIWEQAEKLRSCTVGGHEAWVCPYGCHLVKW